MEELLTELQEIKKLLLVIVSNQKKPIEINQCFRKKSPKSILRKRLKKVF